MRIVGVAVGNSRVQVGVVEGGEIRAVRRAPAGNPEDCFPEGERVRPDAVLLASVNPPAEERVLALVRDRFGVEPLRVTSAGGVGLTNRCRPPERVGIDRLLAARAALERTGTDTLVLDFGTAATANLVSRDRVFHGGLIGPGLSLAARALAGGTAALPAVESPGAPPAFLGRSTEDAIRGGVFWTLVGAVERIVRGIAEEWGKPLVVFATGGDAERVAGATRSIDRVVPTLVLEGLLHVHRDRTC
ncbi:MAG: type III pantothenate kinase [Planctomycetes bacterium]|nr:type III pantothenate kinase [Planctomycetota bacterium]